MDDLSFEFLADRPEAVAPVAEWLYREWGHFQPTIPPTQIADELRLTLNRHVLPFQIVALHNGRPIGVAMVKEHELRKLFPGRKNWIGSVVVEAAYRGQGVATSLVQEAVARSQDIGVSTLHLQTEALDGGLYRRLGWQPTDEVEIEGHRRLVMVRHAPHPDRVVKG